MRYRPLELLVSKDASWDGSDLTVVIAAGEARVPGVEALKATLVENTLVEEDGVDIPGSSLIEIVGVTGVAGGAVA
jgi:hypothetical protein